MANNANNVSGFEVYRHRSGKAVTTIERPLNATHAAMHAGSFVKQDTGAFTWIKAVAGDSISSLAVGFRFNDASGKEVQSDFIDANVAGFVTMIDDPANCEYIGILSKAVIANATTLNFDIINGTDTAAKSLQTIDGGTTTTPATTTLQLRGVRYLKKQGDDNALGDDVTADLARLIVRINKVQSDQALGTVTAVGAP
jgi:hypothetical protein